MAGDDNTAHDKTVVTVIAPVQRRGGASNDDEACLVVIYGQDLGKKHKFYQDSIIIGRSSKCDIHIDEESVSRSHSYSIS